ncbi:hypothetical protein VNO78_10470 [Psophocarpus tetragonolobus]|uniref:Uncharacterized protein n=1 Tax=Psophocarpus tetragonolobus TaxID=3891 RepID=A0AAN9SR68_PSOTE
MFYSLILCNFHTPSIFNILEKKITQWPRTRAFYKVLMLINRHELVSGRSSQLVGISFCFSCFWGFLVGSIQKNPPLYKR